LLIDHRQNMKGIEMNNFLTEENGGLNLNSYVGAGRVSRIEPLTGRTPGLAFSIDYQKTWPSGDRDIWPIWCYVAGAERLEQLKWMKVNEMVVVRGEVTNRNNIYAYQVEPWTAPPQDYVFNPDDFPMPPDAQQ
jgi:hypothetical protein